MKNILGSIKWPPKDLVQTSSHHLALDILVVAVTNLETKPLSIGSHFVPPLHGEERVTFDRNSHKESMGCFIFIFICTAEFTEGYSLAHRPSRCDCFHVPGQRGRSMVLIPTGPSVLPHRVPSISPKLLRYPPDLDERLCIKIVKHSEPRILIEGKGKVDDLLLIATIACDSERQVNRFLLIERKPKAYDGFPSPSPKSRQHVPKTEEEQRGNN
mmetsp:Transcript_6420/g.12444  ORF Transcript_6420/g.12444 Transcript_6420/m.12444 type:complete len:214 (-) Transcript_6420:1031-1672(-)